MEHKDKCIWYFVIVCIVGRGVLYWTEIVFQHYLGK